MGDHVFICYAREDQEFVFKLVTSLKDRGVPIWLDQWDIPFDADWDQAVDNALNNCTRFLIVLSPKAVESKEVRGELRTALNAGKSVVPVLHQACRIPCQLQVIQHVDFTVRGLDDETILNRLVHTLHVPESGLPESGEKTPQEETERREREQAASEQRQRTVEASRLQMEEARPAAERRTLRSTTVVSVPLLARVE